VNIPQLRAEFEPQNVRCSRRRIQGRAMDRRNFVALIGSALAAPLVRAQAADKVYRIGYVSTYPSQKPSHLLAAFLDALRALGYVEGRNLVFDHRHAGGRAERMPQVMRELADSNPDVIVTSVNAQTRAAKQATQTIPIVMIIGTDVEAEGFVASLARPGGNITGLSWDVDLKNLGKRLELLKEAVPTLSRIAVLWDPGQDARASKATYEQAGAALGLTLIWIDYTADLEQMFRAAQRERAEALFSGGGARLFGNRRKIVELAAKYRLPDAHYTGEFVEAGGLMSYAPNLAARFRQAATYVDRILRGASPADLPVERPEKIELLINLGTARALGLAIPQSLLLRADRVIE
jgi:putative ABC transport system substrate-binding protein